MEKISFSIQSESVEKTRLIGKYLGETIEAGTVICLYGELGSGKTAFVQGLGKGLCVPEECYITSPTYTLINEYPGKFNIFHIDLYRIEDINDLEDIGFYETLNDKSVTAIEWAERLGEDFFADYLEVSFKIISDDLRIITFIGHGKNGINCSEIRRHFCSES